MMRMPPAPVTSVLDAIGGTPLVELTRLPPDGYARVFVKLEYFNPTGSYKDRMAKAMIGGGERRGGRRAGGARGEGARAEAKRIHEEEGPFWTDQFNNCDAVEGYTGIGREIFAQLDDAPDAFVGAVGTAGMLVGVASALKKRGTRIV